MTLLPQVQAFRDPASGLVSYLVLCPECGECAVLDASHGHDAEARAAQIVSFVRRNGLTLRWLADTHCHEPLADRAARRLQQVLGGQRVGAACDATEQRYDLRVADGDELPLGNGGLRVLHTPGHTPGSVSFRMGPRVFVGGLLGLAAGGLPELLVGGSWEAVRGSVQRLLDLPADTTILVGYSRADGESLRVEDLRRVCGGVAADGLSRSPDGLGRVPH